MGHRHDLITEGSPQRSEFTFTSCLTPVSPDSASRAVSFQDEPRRGIASPSFPTRKKKILLLRTSPVL